MSPKGTYRNWDDYFIPGTEVLRNKFTSKNQPYGESDPDKLRQLEEGHAFIRFTELMDNPIKGEFDYKHFKAIHAYIFQDVYEWAGQERVAPTQFMTKDGHAYYPAGPSLTNAANAEFEKLAAKDYLQGLECEKFVSELAESWGELNVVHSFREGNTRAQFVFFSQLCEQAGYELDTASFTPGSPLRDDFVQARFHSQDTGSNECLAGVLRQAVKPLNEVGRSGNEPGYMTGKRLVQGIYSSLENSNPAKYQTPGYSGRNYRGTGRAPGLNGLER